MNTTASPNATILIDAHVHVYPAFDARRLLERAAARFAEHSADHKVLALVDLPGINGFQRLRDAADGPWTVRETQEPAAMQLQKGALTLTVIDGRQWRTPNGLEVLGLGLHGPQVDLEQALRDDMDLQGLLAEVERLGGIGVLPYGVGKWSGTRGAIIDEAIRAGAATLVLGDNGNRLNRHEPEILADARRNNIPILPGTDPLPLPGHVGRVGQMVGRFSAPWQADRPVESLRWAMEQRISVEPLGCGSSWPRFVCDQVAMQLRGKWLKLRGVQKPVTSATESTMTQAVEVNA